MANMTERLADLEKRMLFVEEQLGIETAPIIQQTIKKQKQEIEHEQTTGGFTKDQLRMMFTWAKSMRLDQLSKNDFEELRKWDMLNDFFPNAPDKYEDIIL